MIQIQIHGVKELANKFQRLQQKIPVRSNKAIKKVLIEGRRIAREKAPIKTGALKAGIRYRMFPKEHYGVLMSTVEKDFPYHFWVNEMPGYKYATLAKRRMRNGSWPTRAVRNRWPKIYTQKRMYRTLAGRTGEPGYFTKTIEILEKKYPKIMREQIRRAIKSSGFKGG